MEAPDFERPKDDYEFSKGEEIYIIDKNKIDLWKAIIKKVSPDKVSVHYEASEEDKKYSTTKRFLLRTDHNNEIFNQQEEIRAKSVAEDKEEKMKAKLKDHEKKQKQQKKKQEKPKPKAKSPSKPKKKKKVEDEDEDEDDKEIEDDDDEENIEMQLEDDESDDSESSNEDPSNDYDNGSQTTSNSEETAHRRKKSTPTKKPIIDNQYVIHSAWESGIHDVDSFRSFMLQSIESTVEDFEKLYKMNNVSEFPPFKIGGNVDTSEIEKFWTQSQVIWKKLFGELESVPTKDFLKKAVPFFKLPNQREANARDTLKFIFDPEVLENTDFVQFCCFLAMFGPHQTAIRKIGHWLKCPAEMKDLLLFPDIPDGSVELTDDTEMNCFTLKTGDEEEQEGSNEKYVYNIPYIDTDGSYLVDTEGNTYKDWSEYFEKNNPKAESKEE